MTLRGRALTGFATAAVLAAVFVFATGPDAPRRTVPSGDPAAGRTIRGAFHIHTNRSDGALDRADVAAAAARAGLGFAIFTDHGDGTRSPDPPAYIHGVLCVDGVEISTNAGHYIALGLPRAPYPLGGDADAVAEDVRRLGGIGIAAHPDSPRPDLRWSDRSIPIDGVEWLNADSEWRDESRLRLAHAVLAYLWRPSGALTSLLDRPVALRRWDELAAVRRVVGLAAHDAHGGIGSEDEGKGRRLHVPTYLASFRAFSTHAVLERPLTGDAPADAALLLAAIQGGRLFTAVEAIATPATLDFNASAGDVSAGPGDVLPPAAGSARFHVRASVPSGSRTVLIRNGTPIAESNGGALDWEGAETGAYRVEVRVDSAPGTPPVPWLVSNPIYRLPPPSTAPIPAPTLSPVLTMGSATWHIESSPGSSGEIVQAAGGGVSMRYRLAEDRRSSPFAALAVDLPAVPAEVSEITLKARSAAPMRVSVQLRFAGDHARWGRSVYVDSAERDVRVPVSSLRPMGPAGPPGRPSIAEAATLLFVVDLTNAAPGARGSLALTDVAFGR